MKANEKVSRNESYGKVYFTGVKSEYGADSAYKKLRNKASFGGRKKSYGSHGKFKVE